MEHHHHLEQERERRHTTMWGHPHIYKTIAFLFAPLSFVFLLTFFTFVFTHWSAYVSMTGTAMAWFCFVLAAGVILLLAWFAARVLLFLGHGVVDLFLKLAHGMVDLYHKWSEAKGQAVRNKVIYTCDEYSLIDVHGEIQMVVPDREKSHPALPPPPAGVPMLTAPATVSVSESECLNLAPSFHPHADQILSGRGSIFGVSGSGKSVTFAVFSEEIGRLGVPFLLADTEDEYSALLPWLPHGQLVDARMLPVAHSEQFGRYLLENTMQVILNLASYETDDEAALAMIGLIAGMREWEEERGSERRVSCMFLLDEAAVWLPQNVKESRLSDEVLSAMHTAFFADLVRRGRKRGMGFTLATQRIAEIDKRALQSNWRLLHRQTEDADLKRYEALGVSREDTLSLGNGEAFITTPEVSNLRTQIRMRHSPHSSTTPGIESIRRYQDVREISPKSFRTDETPRNDFVAPEKPFQMISDISKSSVLPSPNAGKGVPETLKLQIIQDHERGLKTKKGRYNRTEIQEHLGLNDDQYWMIKQVLDEYEGKRSA